MRLMPLLVLCILGSAGCLADRDDPVPVVRLELENQGAIAVSGWLRAETSEGSILMQRQFMVKPGSAEGVEQPLVVDDLQQFRAILSHTGEDVQTLVRGMDGDCYTAERIAFRVVAGPGPGPAYDLRLACS